MSVGANPALNGGGVTDALSLGLHTDRADHGFLLFDTHAARSSHFRHAGKRAQNCAATRRNTGYTSQQAGGLRLDQPRPGRDTHPGFDR